MTITDLRTYVERMERKALPTDTFSVKLTRNAITYIGAFLSDRKASLEKALADPKIKPAKAANRALKYGMVTEAMETIEKAKEL